MPSRTRDFVEPYLRAWMESNGCCPPYPPPHLATTSVARRWSQLLRVKMQRATPHPRPWDGPGSDWRMAIARGDYDGMPFFGSDHARELGA